MAMESLILSAVAFIPVEAIEAHSLSLVGGYPQDITDPPVGRHPATVTLCTVSHYRSAPRDLSAVEGGGFAGHVGDRVEIDLNQAAEADGTMAWYWQPWGRWRTGTSGKCFLM